MYKHPNLEHFKFTEGYWFEDTPISYMIAALPVRIATTDSIVYGYRLNQTALQQKPFDLQYDQRAYEYLLKHTLMNAGRICKQPRKIRESVFVLTSYLKNEYFDGFNTNDYKMMKLEKAMEKKRFFQFELLKLHI